MRTPRRRSPLTVSAGLLLGMAMLAAACGQKPGTHVAATGTGAGFIAGDATAADPGTGTEGAVDPAIADPAAAGGSGEPVAVGDQAGSGGAAPAQGGG